MSQTFSESDNFWIVVPKNCSKMGSEKKEKSSKTNRCSDKAILSFDLDFPISSTYLDSLSRLIISFGQSKWIRMKFGCQNFLIIYICDLFGGNQRWSWSLSVTVCPNTLSKKNKTAQKWNLIRKIKFRTISAFETKF